MTSSGVQVPRLASLARNDVEIVGPVGAPVVLAIGGISASRSVTTWWGDIAGQGKVLDTNDVRVLGVDFLDGGCGPDGRPDAIVTTHDQAAHIVDILDALDIEQLDAVVGASYGGMVALALAERWPERVAQLVVVNAAHEPHPMAVGLRAVQRRVVELGLETNRVADAMALARSIAMTTYRSTPEFTARFDVEPVITGNSAEFDVERYLVHAGERFAERMRADRFLALSLSIDLHRVIPEAVSVPTTVIASTHDAIAPEAQLAEMAARLPGLTAYHVIDSCFGHDAFLTEPQQLASILSVSLAH
ncbi:MAG: homoserine O-succinyltransferase [Gemmatimonadaceae bacterium]